MYLRDLDLMFVWEILSLTRLSVRSYRGGYVKNLDLNLVWRLRFDSDFDLIFLEIRGRISFEGGSM